MPPRNIFLTGFMGAGKSKVGSLLAKKLGWSFVDTDELVEGRAGKSIEALFHEGEEKFRKLEAEIVSEVTKKDSQVVALGGGALLKQQSRLDILTAGCLIYLAAKPETLLSRLEKSGEVRPLLEKYGEDKRLDAIRDLLKERQNVYESAHGIFHTDTKTLETVVQEVLLYVKGSG
jgi:shikimate kinase